MALPALSPAQTVKGLLNRASRDLTEECRSKKPESLGRTLAVFTFRCHGDLEKRQVGHAVAELLADSLSSEGRFKVLERGQLKRILEEQSLALAGITDPGSAAVAGRLAGAALGVLGAVDGLGDRYQIHARLVDLDTGEVLATSYQEVSRGAFDTEARSYLQVLPEREALGLFIGLGYGGAMPSSFEPVVVGPVPSGASFGYTAEISGLDRFPAYYLAGLRYFILRRLVLEAAYAPRAYGTALEGTVKTNPPGFPESTSINADFVGQWGELGGFWSSPSSSRRRWFCGAALAVYGFGKKEHGSTGNGNNWSIGGGEGVMVLLKGGLEWKPKDRFGLSIQAFANPSPPKIEIFFGRDDKNPGVKAAELSFPAIGAALQAGVYF